MTSRRAAIAVLVAAVVLVVIGAAALVALSRPPAGPTAESPPPAAEPTATKAGAPASPSPAAGWYQVYFTQPSYPDRPENHRGGIDERLVDFIDSGRTSVDIAIYDFDLENVADALARAVQRGARVRMVTDSDTVNDTKNEEIQAALGTVEAAGIPIVEDNRAPIMHHKFVVVDGAAVLTGSWNFTIGDTYRLNNHAAIIRSPDLAANYTAEFEKMFVRKLFGPNKQAGATTPVLTIQGTRVENYFAPEDEVAAKIVNRLAGARSSVRFLAFSFTHDGIGQALRDLHQSGIAVEGVFETTGSETRFSEYGKLKEAGIPVWQDGNPYVMHHKVFIIDDQAVIFGSFN
ncbi:MAG TPA: phospholipase D-like domain-containing protein, partial [Dehalococcoidia bacterium]|nr:phospholipase D-like domain-containing protein [Dehalococcoidia bacterium]